MHLLRNPRRSRPEHPRLRGLRRVLLAAPVLLLLAPGPAAEAADNGAWSVTPTPPATATAPRDYFVLEADPGQKIRDKVRVQNWTNRPITFKIHGADGYNTATDGFFALKAHGDTMTDVGAWVTPVTSQVTVYPKTQVDIPFTLKVPKNASPGDHVGGVVASNVAVESTSEDEDGLQVGVQRAVGARVYLRVFGPTTPALEVSDVRLEHDRGVWPWTGEGKGTVSWTVENTGNVRLAPEAEVALDGWRAAGTSTEQVADLLPGQQTRLSREVSGVAPLGRVTATVTLTAPGDVHASASTRTWLVPWPGLVVLLAMAVLATWWWRRRRASGARRLDAVAAAPTLTLSDELPGDDLPSDDLPGDPTGDTAVTTPPRHLGRP